MPDGRRLRSGRTAGARLRPEVPRGAAFSIPNRKMAHMSAAVSADYTTGRMEYCILAESRYLSSGPPILLT
ncbi:hypothetical protein NDU88_007985 [Pleurodeles waltl]|uniref:Uncharacterized protein n=1 Tax=Pleurodeles waltl TaxID=8319 RepID=A0AAV7SU25_PLEWA|nr:hypothetical protein NDU88_007985 [Pleurodeles waltl]